MGLELRFHVLRELFAGLEVMIEQVEVTGAREALVVAMFRQWLDTFLAEWARNLWREASACCLFL